MATTYGYGGEFSSDEDLDKIEQQTEKVNRFDGNQLKPGKKEIEELIETIRGMPYDQDVNLSDDLLAGLLDYYKTQRGPIVDSTRKLYKKIVLRLVRGDTQHQVEANSDNAKDSNGNAKSNNNNNNNNNNDEELVAKRPQVAADSFSSDDDDEVEMLSSINKKNLDNRVLLSANNNKSTADNEKLTDGDLMEVDSETPSGPVRETKPVDLPTTDEDSGEETDESSNSDDSESVLEVTPIRPQANQRVITGMNNEAPRVESNLVTPKHAESSVKRQQPIAQSTPKETMDSVKKPYTRSQRMAAARAAASKEKVSTDVASKTQNSSPATSVTRQIVSRKKYYLLTVTLVVVMLAIALYHFKSNIIQTAEPLFKRNKITF